MCLYPRLMKNRKYTATKKNKGVIPECTDERVKMVAVGCGKCMECLKQRANGWKIRLNEEIKHDRTAKFITLTFSEEELTKLEGEIEEDFQGYDRDNEVATLAVRRFLERWRKKYKKSVKHWLVTELGQTSTERIHLHGLIWTKESPEEILKIWKYGISEPGKYVNETTIGYITKYLSKADIVHKEYKSIVLCSPGIGNKYTEHEATRIKHSYKPSGTKEVYKTKDGYKMGMPTYYRNKLYSEEEREKLWIEKLDADVRYVNGVKIENVSTHKGNAHYEGAREAARQKNKRLGYGELSDWNRYEYEKKLRNLKALKRQQRKWKNDQNGT